MAAVLVIAFSVVTAADAGYRIVDGSLMLPSHRQGYIFLRSFDPPEMLLLVALTMLAAAAYVGIARRGMRIAALTIMGLALATTAFTYYVSITWSFELDESDGSVVASSSTHDVVRYMRPGFFRSDAVVLHLRTRDGIASYERGEDLACFIEARSGAGPERLFGSASIIGDNTVRVTAQDGTAWDIRFDPDTLHAVNPVDRCIDAPDRAGD
jgi:hypothetical protein